MYLKPYFIPWRFYGVILFILTIVLGLISRTIDLAIIKHHFLASQGAARAERNITIPAFRGMITDRNGYPLAISTSVFSVWVNPTEFFISNSSLKNLSLLLNLQPKSVQTLVKKYDALGRVFVYLKRGVSPEIAQQIKKLAIPGVYLQQDYKRFYPEGEVAAHLIGFTNIDDKGDEGLELLYNKWLAGIPGKNIVIKDRLGRIISKEQTLQEQQPGKDLTLSIDHRIQYLAYRELLEGVQKNQAVSGSVVVLDIKTGEVLAMVNQPSFNPNNLGQSKSDTFRNRAVTDVFEPGSTIKAFSIASALDSGKYKPDSVIDTTPGWLRVGHNLVRDEHRVGLMSVTQILQISSNVGTTKMILSLPPNQLWNMLRRVGFGEATNLGFPGERAGILRERRNWPPFAVATLSFGYGISVTTLQLAEAYAVIANLGMKIPFSLLKQDKMPSGNRVLDANVAREMLQMLEAVVSKGGSFGEYAVVPGYRVAGKTGTAIIASAKGYEKHHYESSFVGIAPASNPRLVIAVVIHDPRGKQYYGGQVSGPVFEKIMEGALRILDIPPDNIIQPKV